MGKHRAEDQPDRRSTLQRHEDMKRETKKRVISKDSIERSKNEPKIAGSDLPPRGHGMKDSNG